MQTTSTFTTGIHCKVATQAETRRFFFEGQTFQALAETICQLLGFSKDSVVIKYSDDEGDLVTISSDEELNFARATATGGLLRLTVSDKSVKPTLVKDSAQPVNPAGPAENPWREKWHKKAQDPQWISDRINRCQRKRQYLQARLAQIDASNPDNSKHVAKLQGKIQFLSSRIDCLTAEAQNPQSRPKDAAFVDVTPNFEQRSKEDVIREMNTLRDAIPAMRFALRQANLQTQLRRTEMQAAQHQIRTDQSISRERLAEIKQGFCQAKEAERAKKEELKAHSMRLCATRKALKDAKMGEKATRKCNKDQWKRDGTKKKRCQKSEFSCEKSEEIIPVVCSAPVQSPEQQTVVLLQ